MQKKALHVDFKAIADTNWQRVYIKTKNYRSLINISVLFTILFITTNYGIDTPTINIVGQMLNWTFIAVSISLILTACLALVIVLVDCVFATLKLVEDFHSGHR